MILSEQKYYGVDKKEGTYAAHRAQHLCHIRGYIVRYCVRGQL